MTVMDNIERGFIDLAGAILKLAVGDYIVALKTQNARNCKKLERFFLSEWGQLLSMEHGDYIIEQCKKLVAQGKCDDLKQNE